LATLDSGLAERSGFLVPDTRSVVRTQLWGTAR